MNDIQHFKHFKFVILRPVSESEIVIIYRSSDPNKSTIMNDIPIKFFKMCTVIVAPLLTNMFNCSIEQGIFPDNAQIIPIYKKNGPKKNCCNYRPITFLSPISKIFEKCIYEQIQQYINKYNLLTYKHFGFRPCLSF